MVKLSEKWIIAALLAIILHVGIFSIFYLNFNEDTDIENTNIKNTDIDNTTISVSEENDVTELSDAPDLYKKLPPLKTQTAEKVLSKDEIPSDDSNLKDSSLPATDKSLTLTDNEMPILSIATTTKPIPPKDSEVTIVQTLQKNDVTPKEDSSAGQSSTALNKDKVVETAIKDASLLAMDIPTQSTTVKMDKEYQAIKDEVEEANSKLSEAINEVKKRNQQKIDNMQKQQSAPQGEDKPSNESN